MQTSRARFQGRGRPQEALSRDPAMRLALYQPDIPQNTGALLRLAACLEVDVDLIEPCGFLLDDRHFRRAGLDYAERARLTRHASWADFLAAVTPARPPARLLLLTTRGDQPHVEFRFRRGDILLLGQESAGAPPAVHAAADARLRIPIAAGLRSLNLALAAAIVLGEALRQTDGFPRTTPSP